MCVSCEGRIPFDADVCPYCSLQQTALNAQKETPHRSLQDSLASLYPPPYMGKGTSNTTKPLQDPMTEKRFNPPSMALGAPTVPVQTEEPQADEGKSSFLPILLLSLSAQLLMLGLLQLLFCDQGFLRLEWDSSYWFVYCLAGLPLLFFGFKKLKDLI